MKKYFTLILILILTFCSSKKNIELTPTEKKNITKKIHNDISFFCNAFNNKKYDSILDMMIPDIFLITSRESFKESFKKADSIGLDLKINLKKIDSLGNLIEFRNKTYSLIYYNTEMIMDNSPIYETIFNNRKISEKKKDTYINKWNKKKLEHYISVYGKENVTQSLNKFYINSSKIMIGMSEKKLENWKYLEFIKGEDNIFIEELVKKLTE